MPDRKIWAIGGGKGGVGKSFITSNLAIALARWGKQVVAIDLDLGGANLHTALGVDIPSKTLTDFFSGRVKSIQDLFVDTGVSNLKLISGANDSLSAANIKESEHAKLLEEIVRLPTEYVLLDLGAGTHGPTLDYFLTGSRPMITVTPEPTSIENAYRFVKSAYFRWVRSVEAELNLKPLVDQAMDQKNALGIRTPLDLMAKMSQLNPEKGGDFQDRVSSFEIFIVMNQIRTQSDVEIGHSVSTVCKKYFGINSHYVGYLEYDNAVWQSVRKRKALILEYPYSNLVSEFALIAKNLDDYERYPRSNILRVA